MLISRLLGQLGIQKSEERRAELQRNLMRHEARIGGTLFGPVPKGGRREFFCLDEHTWIWHEEFLDQTGKRQIKTTRYDVRPDGILKAQGGQPYQMVSPDEAVNLAEAARQYSRRVQQEVYHFV